MQRVAGSGWSRLDAEGRSWVKVASSRGEGSSSRDDLDPETTLELGDQENLIEITKIPGQRVADVIEWQMS